MALDDDFARLLRSETDRVEWKSSANQRDAILEAVCALANDLADSKRDGYVLIGVDKAGQIRGIAPEGDLDRQQKELADRLRSAKIQPVPSVTVTLVEHDGKHLLVVTVVPYPVPPIVEVDAIPFVRVGTTTRRATEADLMRLRERRPIGRAPFDTRPVSGATIDDVDSPALRRAFEMAREGDADSGTFPSFESWLVQKQYGVLDSGRFVPNAASILSVGKSPQDHIASAWVDFVRYSGVHHDATILTRRAATGTASDQLEIGWTWIAAQIESNPVEASGIRAGFAPNYPDEALKELLRNLVQHRLYEGTSAPGRVEWFDDRVEFSNPGGPFGRASEGEFGSHSDYRNPLLTARLVAAGYVQQLGRGVRRARLQCEQNGNPPLEVETDGFTRVIVRRRR